jgi:TPR repeat protein
MYHHGYGVAKDVTEAARLYRLAANQGHANGQYNLGHKYEYGKGVAKDLAEAVRLYRLAADPGIANAQASLKRLGH